MYHYPLPPQTSSCAMLYLKVSSRISSSGWLWMQPITTEAWFCNHDARQDHLSVKMTKFVPIRYDVPSLKYVPVCFYFSHCEVALLVLKITPCARHLGSVRRSRMKICLAMMIATRVGTITGLTTIMKVKTRVATLTMKTRWSISILTGSHLEVAGVFGH